MQHFVQKRPSPQPMIRQHSPGGTSGNVLRTSYTPTLKQNPNPQNNNLTPHGLRYSQHQQGVPQNPQIQISSPQGPRNIASANRSSHSIKQSEVSFISNTKYGQQSGVSFASQNKAANMSIVDQFPTTILQTQQIIHHTFYPVPVDKDYHEILQNTEKKQSQFNAQDAPLDFKDQKIQILLQKIADLTKEIAQLKLEAKDPQKRQSHFSAYQSQNREELLTSQLESLSEAYKQKDLDTKRLLRDIDMLRQQMNNHSKAPSQQISSIQQFPDNQDLINYKEEIQTLKQQLNQSLQRQSEPVQQKNLLPELNHLKQENEQLKQLLSQSKQKQNQNQNQPKYKEEFQYIEDVINENKKLKTLLGQQEEKLIQAQKKNSEQANYSPQDLIRIKDENDRLRIQNNENSSKLKNLEFKSDIEISQLKFKVQQLQGDVGRQAAQEDRIKILEVEAEEWRSKFVRLNREYHLNQERLILMIAEMDTFRKRFSQMTPIQDKDSAFEIEIKQFQARVLSNIESKGDN